MYFYKTTSGDNISYITHFFKLSLSEAVQFFPVQSLCFVQIQHQPRPRLQYKIWNLTVRDPVNTRLCALSSFFRLFHPVTKVEGGGAYISEGWAKGKWVNGLRASRLFFSSIHPTIFLVRNFLRMYQLTFFLSSTCFKQSSSIFSLGWMPAT